MDIILDLSGLSLLRERLLSDELLQIIGNIAAAAVRHNFDVGGRDESGAENMWKPSKRAEAESGKTLVDTGKMQQSVDYEIHGGTVIVGSSARSDGSQSPYYRKLFEKTGKPKPTSGENYPAKHQFGIDTIKREWLVLPEQDQENILQAIIEYLQTGEIK